VGAGSGTAAEASASIAALLFGLMVSLFTAGVALFADGPFAQRPPVLLASIGIFLLMGMCLGAIAPSVWKLVAMMLAISALPVVMYFGWDILGQLSMMVLAAGFALGDAAAGAFGVWAGARLRARRTC
jgi:hypothetical protein